MTSGPDDRHDRQLSLQSQDCKHAICWNLLTSTFDSFTSNAYSCAILCEINTRCLTMQFLWLSVGYATDR